MNDMSKYFWQQVGFPDHPPSHPRREILTLDIHLFHVAMSLYLVGGQAIP